MSHSPSLQDSSGWKLRRFSWDGQENFSVFRKRIQFIYIIFFRDVKAKAKRNVTIQSRGGKRGQEQSGLAVRI